MCQIKFNFWLISALSSPLQYRLRAGEGRRRCGNKVDSENLKYSRLSDILSDNSNCQTPLSQQPWAEPARDSKSTIICCWFFLKKSIYRSALWKKIMASKVACEEKSLIGTKSRSLKYLFDPRRREGGRPSGGNLFVSAFLSWYPDNGTLLLQLSWQPSPASPESPPQDYRGRRGEIEDGEEGGYLGSWLRGIRILTILLTRPGGGTLAPGLFRNMRLGLKMADIQFINIDKVWTKWVLLKIPANGNLAKKNIEHWESLQQSTPESALNESFKTMS